MAVTQLYFRCLKTSTMILLTTLGFLNSQAVGGMLILENTPLGTWVQTDSKNAVFIHQIADHGQTSFLATQKNGATLGANNNSPTTTIDAFNGSAADASNPDAIFNGGKTRPLKLSEIPLTSNDSFRVFLLDVNQLQSNETEDHIVIDKIEVYVAASDTIKTLADLTNTGPGSMTEKIYDMQMDTYDGTNFSLVIDGDNGNGKADMLFYLKDSLFTSGYQNLLSRPSINGLTDPNVYLRYRYSNYNDGAEEWHVARSAGGFTDPTTPEPASIALWCAGGTAGLIWRNRRKRVAQA